MPNTGTLLLLLTSPLLLYNSQKDGFFVVCFVVLGDQTQGLECARQTLHVQSIKKFFNLRPSKDVKGIVKMFALTLS